MWSVWTPESFEVIDRKRCEITFHFTSFHLTNVAEKPNNLVNRWTELLNQTTVALSCCTVPLIHGRLTMAYEGTSVWENAWILTSQLPFQPTYRSSERRDMQSFPFGRGFECRLSLLVCFHECSSSVVDWRGNGRSITIRFQFVVGHFCVIGRHGLVWLRAGLVTILSWRQAIYKVLGRD